MTREADEAAVRAVVLDYVEGWFDGDSRRMERALHPELVKRSVDLHGKHPGELHTLSARDMIQATAEGEGRREDAPDRQIAITINHMDGGIASVTCICHLYVDLLHVLQTPGGWKIVNGAWTTR